jgi:hypothetical protein
MGVALAAVSEDGHLAGREQSQVGVVVVVDLGHGEELLRQWVGGL